MTKLFFIIQLAIFMVACNTAVSTKNEVKANELKNDSSILQVTTSNDTTNLDSATYFIVVVDTSLNYESLRSKMFALHKQLNLTIDTMGRFYNKTKNLIALPDNDEDEMYAGDYFPRRFSSETLSLEYLSFYQTKAQEKTIALVSGIYNTAQLADSALLQLKKTEPKAFTIKANIYVGCMH